jgi:hypothetical protein
MFRNIYKYLVSNPPCVVWCPKPPVKFTLVLPVTLNDVLNVDVIISGASKAWLIIIQPWMHCNMPIVIIL